MVGTRPPRRAVFVQFADEKIDLGSFEASDRDIEVKFNGKLLKLERQKGLIPPGILGEPVVSDNIGTDLSGGEMIDTHGRDIAHPQELRCFDPRMSRNNPVCSVNQDRIDKSKFSDARGNLVDLLGVCVRGFLARRLS